MASGVTLNSSHGKAGNDVSAACSSSPVSAFQMPTFARFPGHTPDPHDRARRLQLAAANSLPLHDVGELLGRHVGRKTNLDLHEKLHTPRVV